MGNLKVECDVGNVSDGYHTFNELYEHRHALFIALIKTNQGLSWRARKHDDGKELKGWFIAGMNLPVGNITYHLPNRLWDSIEVNTLDKAPKWDGHNSINVIHRLEQWAGSITSDKQQRDSESVKYR